MFKPTNPIEADFHHDQKLALAKPPGPVAQIAQCYDVASPRWLGGLLKLDFTEATIITSDGLKHKVGGVPRGTFVLLRTNIQYVNDPRICNQLVLARVLSSAPTPNNDVEYGTLYEALKSQIAELDPWTAHMLRWSGMLATVLGVFYDDADGKIAFGGTPRTFYGAYSYGVYVPTAEHLSTLINCFAAENGLAIGTLRYSETPSVDPEPDVSILVNPQDFIGETYGVRCAICGKTRQGKSSTLKVLCDTCLRAKKPPSMLIFDPSGEWTYPNDQDAGSLYTEHADKIVHYSFMPPPPSVLEAAKLPPPRLLKVNFYESVALGHNLITQLWDVQNNGKKPPNYLTALLAWSPEDPRTAPAADKKTAESASAFNHFWRTMALWYAALKVAGYPEKADLRVPLVFPEPVKQALLASKVSVDLYDGAFAAKQSVAKLPGIFKAVAKLWRSDKEQPTLFVTDSGDPYFNPVEESLLQVVSGVSMQGTPISGHTYLTNFRIFHDPAGGDVFRDIANLLIEDGKSVIVEMVNADERLQAVFCERICLEVLTGLNILFAQRKLGDRFVTLVFEEAQTLFPAAGRDPNSIYNRLATQGAKFHLAMLYATQSLANLSPDLVKNTENWLILHLDDDREVREVQHKLVFRDVAEDVERMRAKGYAYLYTVSHRFAVPVQIRKYEPGKKP